MSWSQSIQKERQKIRQRYHKPRQCLETAAVVEEDRFMGCIQAAITEAELQLSTGWAAHCLAVAQFRLERSLARGGEMTRKRERWISEHESSIQWYQGADKLLGHIIEFLRQLEANTLPTHWEATPEWDSCTLMERYKREVEPFRDRLLGISKQNKGAKPKPEQVRDEILSRVEYLESLYKGEHPFPPLEIDTAEALEEAAVASLGMMRRDGYRKAMTAAQLLIEEHSVVKPVYAVFATADDWGGNWISEYPNGKAIGINFDHPHALPKDHAWNSLRYEFRYSQRETFEHKYFEEHEPPELTEIFLVDGNVHYIEETWIGCGTLI